MKQFWNRLRSTQRSFMHRMFRKYAFTPEFLKQHYSASGLEEYGLNISRISDYNSPLPILSSLQKNVDRWFKPSDLRGVAFDLAEMKQRLAALLSRYSNEYDRLPSYSDVQKKGYGPGYTAFDAMVLYLMVRDLRPKKYIEVGSGLSTYYSSVAAKKNAEEGSPCSLLCIEPNPYQELGTLGGVEVIPKEVQDVNPSIFESLQERDILFIDSSHVVKIDGDVPYLFLEVVPRLSKGVVVHVHDIPFPFNIPYPPQYWIFDQRWPVFWNEAMLLQAFLAFNESYRVIFSAPLLRHFDEEFLKACVKSYESVAENPNTFSSIWIERVK